MRSLLVILVMFFLQACSPQQTGPVDVKWDRDACERCRMVLSDRMHSAQVRNGENKKVYLFDDVGGAVIWLQDKSWASHPLTEIWVNDHRDGRWIDARKAYYVTGKVTPMLFGLGAQDVPAENAMTFDQAIPYIFEREKRFNQSGADLKGQLQYEHEH